MNPLQQAFVDTFKAWDSEAMAMALIVLAEKCSGMPLTDATKADIAWSCRGLLDTMLTSYFQKSWPIAVPEFSLRLLLHTDVEKPEYEGKSPYPRLTLALNISVLSPETLKTRWREMGIIGTDIFLERNEVKTPHPLRGEPGYQERDPQTPSIYRPKGEIGADVTHTYAHALSVRAGNDSPWLQRYRAGEYKQVWDELVAMGENVRQPDVLPHAIAVAREAMQRCRVNVKRLHTRLQAEHYQFANPHIVYTPPDADILQRIAHMEQRVGPLPLSLCAWYELVGSANFVLETEESSDSVAISDPLVVLPANYVLEYTEDGWYKEQYQCSIALDFFHSYMGEDLIGGNRGYSLTLPDAGMDIVLDGGAKKDLTFIDYIRTAFSYGVPLGDRTREVSMLPDLPNDILPI